jgi:CBS domain containing-hemolysin-like protein
VIGALLVAVALVALNGVFVAAEFALLAATRTRLEPMAEAGGRMARSALSAMGRLGPMLAGTQLAITICSLLLGSVIEPVVAELLEDLSGRVVPVGVARVIGVVLALGIVAFFHLLFGEMVPKSMALSQPEDVLLALAVPVSAFVWVFRPVIWFLNLLARLGARAFGVEASDELRSAATSAELSVMLAESVEEGLLEGDEAELLSSALSFVERRVRDVMVPRDRVVAVTAAASVGEIEEIIRTTGHTRVVITEGDLADGVSRPDLDAVAGFVHAKDLLRLPEDFRDMPLPFRPRRTIAVPADQTLSDLLVTMRARRVHVALVVGPATGARHTEGIVTLEDVLESIVGDIVDETDRRTGVDDAGVDEVDDAGVDDAAR